MPTCGAPTKNGNPCRAKVQTENELCHRHKNTCSICYQPMLESNTRELGCSHRFHTECIERWKEAGRNTCPLCREPFDVPDYNITLTIRSNRNNRTSNVMLSNASMTNVLSHFDLNSEDLSPFITEIDFEASDMAILRNILEQIGIGESDVTGLDLSSLDTE